MRDKIYKGTFSGPRQQFLDRGPPFLMKQVRKEHLPLFLTPSWLFWLFLSLGQTGRRTVTNGWRKKNINRTEDVFGTRNQEARKGFSRPYSEQKQKQQAETCFWIQAKGNFMKDATLIKGIPVVLLHCLVHFFFPFFFFLFFYLENDWWIGWADGTGVCCSREG